MIRSLMPPLTFFCKGLIVDCKFWFYNPFIELYKILTHIIPVHISSNKDYTINYLYILDNIWEWNATEKIFASFTVEDLQILGRVLKKVSQDSKYWANSERSK